MLYKVTSACLAVFLLGSMLWGRCACCPPVVAAQGPVHDCCRRTESGHCGKPGPGQPAPKQCPHQTLALESYAKVELDLADLLAPLAKVTLMPELLLESRIPLRSGSEPLLIHAPPDVYLLNSTFLI